MSPTTGKLRKSMAFFLGLTLVGWVSSASAGPVFIDGTDANDHGFATGGLNPANQDGWLYMQKALENLGSAVNPAATKVVVDLGTTSGQARNAIDSAFNLSSLPGLGWTLTHVDGVPNITNWLNALATTNTGILYIPTANNSTGDLETDELAAINANAVSIDTFVGGAGNAALGGALFSMGESGTGAYGWLSTLLPGIVVTDIGGGGIGTAITLTPAGQTAFPGLTSADLSSGPWHNHFSGTLGGLSILGTAPDNTGATQNIILGGGTGTIIRCGDPGQPPCPPPPNGVVPEPASLVLLGSGLAALLAWRFKKRSAID